MCVHRVPPQFPAFYSHWQCSICKKCSTARTYKRLERYTMLEVRSHPLIPPPPCTMMYALLWILKIFVRVYDRLINSFYLQRPQQHPNFMMWQSSKHDTDISKNPTKTTDFIMLNQDSFNIMVIIGSIKCTFFVQSFSQKIR